MSFDNAWPSDKTRDVEVTYLVYTRTPGRLPRINELYILAEKINRSLIDSGRVLTQQSSAPLNSISRPRTSFAISAPVNVRPGRIHFKGFFLSELDQYDIYETAPVIQNGVLYNIPGNIATSAPTAEVLDDYSDLHSILMTSIPEFELGEVVLGNVKFMSVNFGMGAHSFPS